ncbi:MAG: NAD(P)H-hydrate dehydratase [Clostridia bacterium]|nr:NAD(P)H-hydrate dehydratase [Clostridia bacterium]
MKLATSSMIKEIDAYCESSLGIPTLELMKKSGEAVADTVRKYTPKGERVTILAGKGNNGADGYAAARLLIPEYQVRVYDIFSAGQKSEAGRALIDEYTEAGGELVMYAPTEANLNYIKTSATIVDAIFGTGFVGDIPEELKSLAIAMREAVSVNKIAVDVPLGVDPDDGGISNLAVSSSATVVLSYIKPGILSYPARSYVGEIIYSDLGIPKDKVEGRFEFNYNMIEEEWVRANLPKREANSNKGSFGKLLMIAGCEKYRGAAHRAAEAALRGGVGLLTFLGVRPLCDELSAKFPEIIYKTMPSVPALTDDDIKDIVELSSKHSATLIGSGSDNTDTVLKLTLALLDAEGGPLILDADSINALSGIGEDGIYALKRAKREVVLTPHPLEFARLSISDVASVQLHRLAAAKKFAAENKVTLVLKGAGTVVTDGVESYINPAASSALAKAGSGDVLAGFLSALIAQGGASNLVLSSIAVYLHAYAGQALSATLSTFGVTPSDLPRAIASAISLIESADEL